MVRKFNKWLIAIFSSIAGFIMTGCPYAPKYGITPEYGVPLYGVQVNTKLTGKVVTTNDVPVSGIQIELQEIPLTTTSDNNGAYSFSDLSQGGSMTLKATDIDGSANGSYQTKTTNVILEENTINNIDIVIEE